MNFVSAAELILIIRKFDEIDKEKIKNFQNFNCLIHKTNTNKQIN